MKSNRNNRRRISKWSAIAICDDDTNITTYFALDEYGKLKQKFQKQKPRNLNLFMNQVMEKSDQTVQSNSEENSSQENLESFDFSNVQTLIGNANSQNQKDCSLSDDSGSELSDLFVSSTLIGDTQWCIDYVTSHLLVI